MVDNRTEGFAWQLRVWDRMADVYQREIDIRFSPVIDQVLKLANSSPERRSLIWERGLEQ